MVDFKDQNGCLVQLAFERKPNVKPEHIWVVCRYQQKWLLTNHKVRGLEFPGGKIEQGESEVEAVHREVWEETGALIEELFDIGQYQVLCTDEMISKAIYFATISDIQKKEDYLETEGPVLISTLPEKIVDDPSYSFIMKDQVLKLTLEQLETKQLLKV